MLLQAAEVASSAGHKIGFVWTSKEENYNAASASDFESFAKKHDALFLNTLDIQRGLEAIQEVNVTTCLSMNFKLRLSDKFLSSFQHGVINAHIGDLPRYRGNACANWAILNEEDKVGLAIHQMSEALDSGPIYSKHYLEINENTYIGQIMDWAKTTIPNAFVGSLNDIRDGVQPEVQNPNITPLHCFARRREDSKIDWGRTAGEIRKLIRASSRPFDGAFCHFESDREKVIVIHKASVMNTGFEHLAIPGQICGLFNGGLMVATGSSILVCEDVSLNGGSHTDSISWLVKSLRNRLT